MFTPRKGQVCSDERGLFITAWVNHPFPTNRSKELKHESFLNLGRITSQVQILGGKMKYCYHDNTTVMIIL